jgi:hypothetical protein
MFPTDAAAQECGMSRSEYEEFVYSACFLYDDDPVAKWSELRDNELTSDGLYRSVSPVYSNQCARTNLTRLALCRRSPDSLPVS